MLLPWSCGSVMTNVKKMEGFLRYIDKTFFLSLLLPIETMSFNICVPSSRLVQAGLVNVSTVCPSYLH